MTISRSSLLTIYKSFVRPLLDYADTVFDKPFNESFKTKLEAMQYNANLVITGAIRGTFRNALTINSVLESLVTKGSSPLYLQQILSFRHVQYYQT